MDYLRLVFDRLSEAGAPDATQRADIYDGCRAEVANAVEDPRLREKALSDLERAIRRQEMQAIHEELGRGQ